MKLVVCGNSHVGALRRGRLPRHDRAGLDLAVFPLGKGCHEIDEFSRRTGHTVSLTVTEYAENLARCTGANEITAAATWGLLHVNSNTRIFRDKTWKTFEPAAVAAPAATPVSDDELHAMVVRQQRGVRDLFTNLQNAGIPVLAISAPHPRHDLPDFEGRVRREAALYIDRFARAEWRRWLTTRGITLVEPPAATVTAEGLLRSEFHAPDFLNGTPDRFHANPEYGALLLDDVLDRVATAV